MQHEENKLAVFPFMILKYVFSSRSNDFDFLSWIISPSLIFFTDEDKIPKNLKSSFSTDNSKPLDSK